MTALKIVMLLFGISLLHYIYGDIDERGAATAKLFHIKQRAD